MAQIANTTKFRSAIAGSSVTAPQPAFRRLVF
jgi:hypothetical protein